MPAMLRVETNVLQVGRCRKLQLDPFGFEHVRSKLPRTGHQTTDVITRRINRPYNVSHRRDKSPGRVGYLIKKRLDLRRSYTCLPFDDLTENCHTGKT